MTLGLHFTHLSQRRWAPAQAREGQALRQAAARLQVGQRRTAVEALYTLKVQPPRADAGTSARTSSSTCFVSATTLSTTVARHRWRSFGGPRFGGPSAAATSGRAVRWPFGVGRELRRPTSGATRSTRFDDVDCATSRPSATRRTCSTHAQAGIRAAMPSRCCRCRTARPIPDLTASRGCLPRPVRSRRCRPTPTWCEHPDVPLTFTSIGALEQNVGPLLNTVPFRSASSARSSDLNFDPTVYFFFQDTRRCYLRREPSVTTWTGSAWSPVAPSDPASVPFEVRYRLPPLLPSVHAAVLASARAAAAFRCSTTATSSCNPDTDRSRAAPTCSASTTDYQPGAAAGRLGPATTSPRQDREFLDFSCGAAYSRLQLGAVLPHPALHRRAAEPEPAVRGRARAGSTTSSTRRARAPSRRRKRFWIPKPLYDLTERPRFSQQRINNLLDAVNQGDPDRESPRSTSWRKDPFNPFLLADQRPVAYMKRDGHVLSGQPDRLGATTCSRPTRARR